MSKFNPKILKIGGSVITDKSKELQVRMQVINRLAEEIQKASIQNLVIVHGGGSFGHPLAQKYAISEGLKEETQKHGFSETHHVMTVLNGLFMDALIWRDIPAVSITPSSCIIAKDGRIEIFEDTPLRILLKLGFLPVLYGDAVLDLNLGFTIVSGDQLVSILAIKLNAEHVIVGVDVDGLYADDPKIKKSARIFRHLTLDELRKQLDRIRKPESCDVTGGMYGKITELSRAVEYGIPVTIVNAARPNYVYKALKGKKVESTSIEKE